MTIIHFEFGKGRFINGSDFHIEFQIQCKIFDSLSTGDQKNCRLVCKKWRDVCQQLMFFGFWLNDFTCKWIPFSTLPIEWLAVGDLSTPLDLDRLEFVRNASVVVLEVNVDTFRSNSGPDPDANCSPDIFYTANECQSILPANVIGILENATTAYSVCLHRWTLSNFNETDDPDWLFRNVHLPNVCILTVSRLK